MHYGIVFVCFALCLPSKAQGSAQLEVKLVRYDNPGGKGSNGNPCDGFGIVKRSDCDHFFQICVDWESNGSPSMGDCDVGYIQTGYVHNSDSFDFGSVIGEGPDSSETDNPILFSVTTWNAASGVRVKVHVKDDDTSTDDEEVELLPPATVHLQPAASETSASWQEKIISGRTTLTINVKAYCNENYYGSDCSVWCVPTNGTAGHYTCGPDGSKDCLPGWEGPDCATSEDDCAISPCLNGAECVDGDHAYTCQCTPLYTGTNCEEAVPVETTTSSLGQTTEEESGPDTTHDIDAGPESTTIIVDAPSTESDSTDPTDIPEDPTTRAAVATTVAVAVTTSPPSKATTGGPVGMTTPVEETMAPEHDTHSPDAQTTAGETTTNRATPPSIIVDPCNTSPCQNGGQCSEARGDADYDCECQDGYEGDDCEILIDNCANSPCRQGRCENHVASFLCHCEPGWQGTTCNLDINECENFPTCQNGGICVNSPGSHECVCQLGWTGAACEHEIPCNCLHGGSCVYTAKASSGYDVTCTCVGDWSGALCSVSPCSYSPCQNMGHCIESDVGYSCNCEPGYTGFRCEVDIDDCQTHDCQHQSVCEDGVNSYTCSCPKGFRGDSCQIEKDLADGPVVLMFDGVMDRDQISGVDSEIAHFVAKTEGIAGQLSVEHEAGTCKTQDGPEVTIFEFKVIDEQGESLRVKNMDGLEDALSGKPYTGSECAEPVALIHESKENGDEDKDYWKTVLGIIIGMLCIVLIALIIGLIYYSRKQERKDTGMTANGSFRYREVSPGATTSKTTERASRPRSFRCHSDDSPSAKIDMD